MGDAKRRREALGDKYGKEQTILPWLPFTKTQADLFYKWTTKGAWIGIGLLVAYWVLIRLLGPGLGLWNFN